MSCGIVLWPDEDASYAIKQLWEELSAHGIPTLATHTHQLHRPHVSLSVAESLPVQDALHLAGTVPTRRVRLLVESAGVFPTGHLFLACVAGQDLLAEQRRVHQSLIPIASNPWPHFAADEWTPHITTGWALRPSQIAAALPRVLDRLPIRGWLDHGGVEDGHRPILAVPTPKPPPSLGTDDRVRHRLANFPNTARKYPLNRRGEVLSILLPKPGLASLTLTEVNPGRRADRPLHRQSLSRVEEHCPS